MRAKLHIVYTPIHRPFRLPIEKKTQLDAYQRLWGQNDNLANPVALFSGLGGGGGGEGGEVCDVLYERTHSPRRNSHKNMTFARFLVHFYPLTLTQFSYFPTFPGEHTRGFPYCSLLIPTVYTFVFSPLTWKCSPRSLFLPVL